MMKAEINWNEFNDIAPRILRALNLASEYLALEVYGNLQENSPQDHGRLAGAWELHQQGERTYMVTNPVSYASVQNDGSDPYEIFPRNAQSLVFEVGGQTIFAKRVQHPGIEGTGYIDQSLDQAESRIPEFVAMALDEEGLT